MRRIAPVIALVLVANACTGSGGAASTTEGPVVSTSSATTVDVKVCEDLGDETVQWVGDMVSALEGIRYEVFLDKTQWPDDLLRLDEEGAALQAESDAAGCDEAVIRGKVVAAAAEMHSDSATARLFLDLLVPSE